MGVSPNLAGVQMGLTELKVRKAQPREKIRNSGTYSWELIVDRFEEETGGFADSAVRYLGVIIPARSGQARR